MRSPIRIPAWLITAKYALFILIGLAVYATNPPAFERAYEEWYTPVWAIAVCIAGTVALTGSLVSTAAEKWGASALFILMWVYAVAPIALVISGDTDRLAYSIIAVTLSLLPYARAIQLWNEGKHA
jgi:hypothetical protein